MTDQVGSIFDKRSHGDAPRLDSVGRQSQTLPLVSLRPDTEDNTYH